ncbi:hypothetical protein SAMN05421827_12259 [Pedobacter terrae]|uniref:Uncharacterized protein n=1 Tax=Pedobacter terrae TaxID=405671 RepID=A0A1G8BUM3_9SPHI|nr:hypothetical protein SAMN05421827_12259 [Pedobacter terrae]
MKYLILLIIIFSIRFIADGQEKENIYYSLKSGKYTKTNVTRYVTIKTRRLDTAYSFTLPCNCTPRTLLFYHNTNPESGPVNEKIYTISKKNFRQIRFVNLETLIDIIKKNDTYFNKKFDLFLVEPGEIITVFPVFKFTSFGDYADDVIGP